jgi:CRP/FNR family transcriptional regulator, cyclic AMP receptor protein
VFSSATPVRIHANEVLFAAGDAGDGCYRIEDGLLKVTMVSRAGNERILAFLGPGACRRTLNYRRAGALSLGSGGATAP